MLKGNVKRSLVFLEDKFKPILAACKIRERDLSDVLAEYDFESGWKFYKEIMPHLEAFAIQEKNEQITAHVKEFIEHFNIVEEYLNSRRNVKSFQSIWSPFKSFNNTDKFERMFQDLVNNIGNLIYQIRISE